jgi:hypothetical protein
MAMKRADGKVSEADYLMNCSYFEWYSRMYHGNLYNDWLKTQYK